MATPDLERIFVKLVRLLLLVLHQKLCRNTIIFTNRIYAYFEGELWPDGGEGRELDNHQGLDGEIEVTLFEVLQKDVAVWIGFREHFLRHLLLFV